MCNVYSTFSFTFIKSEYNGEMTKQDSIFAIISFISALGLMTYLIYIQQ